MLEKTRLAGMDVSQLALGAMLFGASVEENLSRRLLDQYVEAGDRKSVV